MPRVHTQIAAKDYPESGILKGTTYHWWKFRHGWKVRSSTYPRASQLTQSEYLGRIYELQDRMGSEPQSASTPDELVDLVAEYVSELEELASEQEEKLSNMPESLQSGPRGELLQERADACSQAASELESIDLDTDLEGEGLESWMDEKRGEIESVDLSS